MVTLTPGGRLTRSGTSLLVVESLPSSALVFWPQASTRPPVGASQGKEPPALMAVTFVPDWQLDPDRDVAVGGGVVAKLP